MRWATALVLIAAMPAGAVAQEAHGCSSLGALAAGVMDLRQKGAIMSAVIAAIPDDDARESSIEIVKRAYTLQRFESPQNHQKAVSDFRNGAELACYQAEDWGRYSTMPSL